jgi:glycosyltransferase involved in cell wall biosynthesis
MREDFLRRYPGVEPWRFVVIPNGYDEADFGWLEGAENGGPFTVVYPGIVDGGNRNPVPLIQSVGLAIKAGEIPAEEIRLCFLGGGPYLFGDEVEGALRDWNLTRQTVRVRDRVSYRESLSRLAVADVLIVLSEPVGRGPWLDGERAYSRLMVPAKVYEYMRLGRPILALVGDGAVKDLFTELEAGQAVAPDDPEMAARFLVGCYTARAEARYRERRCPGGLGRYERRALTERLAAEFESVTVGVGG